MNTLPEPGFTEVFLDALAKLQKLIEQGRLSEALDKVNKFIEILPTGTSNLAYPLAFRGQIYGQLGNLPAALADLQESVRLKPTAAAYFNLSLAYLHSSDKTNGLAALLRAVQLEPDDAEAQSLRDALAKDLGLAELNEIAKVVERFMLAQCGPGQHWKVELRKMQRFLGDGNVETYNAVVLDLCQSPIALIQIRPAQLEYSVVVNVEQSFPGVTAQTMIEAVTKEIPSDGSALMKLLNAFISAGVLVRGEDRLRYAGEPKTAA